MAEGHAASRKTKVVGAIQWGFVGFTLASAVTGAITDYYFFVREGFGVGIPSPWGTVTSLAIPVAVLCGLVAGYSWVAHGTRSPEQERREHRKRVEFVVLLLLLGFVSMVVRAAASELLGEALFTVPYFLLPAVLGLLELPVAYAAVYVFDVNLTDATAGGVSTDGSYRPSRLAGVVGGAQWALTALYGGFVAFGVVSSYLMSTRESFSFSPVWHLLAAVAVAFVAGYLWARRDVASESAAELAHRRRIEYLLALIAAGIAVGLLLGVAMTALGGVATGVRFFALYAVGTFGVSVVAAYLLVYVAEVPLLERVLST